MSAKIASFVLSVIAGLVSGWLIWIFKYIFEEWKNICIAIYSKLLWNTEIRVSISYLFQIKADNKYLLIKGSRIDQYQPVGGVFKMLDSFKEAKRNFELKDDDNLPIDETSKDDLRVRVKGKNLIKLLHWFYTRKNREVGVHREFYEEMIKTGILPEESLRTFNPEYCTTINTPIRDSVHFNCKEILIYEIYELTLNGKEEHEVITYVKANPDKAVLTKSSDIQKECIELDGVSKKIGEHAKHIL